MKISIITLILNLFLFFITALLIKSFLLIFVQLIAIIGLIFANGVNIKSYKFQRLIYLLPILFFIILLNTMHGSGEVMFKFGPFLFIKQGLIRGLYYALFILVLYLMSRFFTVVYGEDKIVENLQDVKVNENIRMFFFTILYVIRIFNIIYNNLGTFIKRSNKSSFKDKLIKFFYFSFIESKKYRELMYINKSSNSGLKLRFCDYVYLFSIVLVYSVIYYLKYFVSSRICLCV